MRVISANDPLRDFLEVFQIGMDRNVPDMLPFMPGEVLNLGAGNKLIDGTRALDAERGWKAGDIIQSLDATVGGAYAFHFFEHLTKPEVLGVLRELERVLVVGGSLICVTPHVAGSLAFEDLDHKSYWTEDTWRNLLSSTYRGATGETARYTGTTPRGWRFRIHASLIMGLALRNLVTVTQIVRT